MRPVQNADGHVGLSSRPYPVEADEAIREGQVVQLSGGVVVPAVTAQTGAVLGIAAENHSGVLDGLNPRSNGTELLVYDNPGLIFECSAPEVTAESGSITTLVSSAGSLGTFTDDAFNGGVLQLAAKGAESGNDDTLGMLRPVTDYAASTYTFTIASGGAVGKGDVYRLYPPLGFAKGGLDAALARLVVSGSGATALKVVGHDYERGMLRLMAASHSLGVEA